MEKFNVGDLVRVVSKNVKSNTSWNNEIELCGFLRTGEILKISMIGSNDFVGIRAESVKNPQNFAWFHPETLRLYTDKKADTLTPMNSYTQIYHDEMEFVGPNYPCGKIKSASFDWRENPSEMQKKKEMLESFKVSGNCPEVAQNVVDFKTGLKPSCLFK